MSTNWRKTPLDLLPAQITPTAAGKYDLYPTYPLASGQIQRGFATLAQTLAPQQTIIIDGYGGVFWEHFRARLDVALRDLGIEAHWIDVREAMRSPEAIQALIRPYLGGDDPYFGTRFTGQLRDFFDADKLKRTTEACPGPESPKEGRGVTTGVKILYGSGAALVDCSDAFLVYVDLPKNEIQYRSRAGAISNLGATEAGHPKKMYKRFYYVDWVALNRHKADMLPRIDLIVDEQRRDEISIMSGDTLRAGLDAMAHSYFRVRPWFETGVWGGNWSLKHIEGLATDVANYAWSFEMITPENGLIFESDGNALEVTFDWLMYHDNRAILGDCAERFQHEFPVRLNFLDTFDGGNLSVQCHPSTPFIREHFGESFQQDETYYILDHQPGAKVNIGFQAGIDPQEFETALHESFRTNSELDVYRYVNYIHPAKHDLVLIPYHTIHSSGRGNLVLEISATPYLYTFKLYDWIRPDLNGKPRALNIERGMQQLNFERNGERVFDELIAKPCVIKRGRDWQLVHLRTHPHHFFDVVRYEFDSTIECDTQGTSFHIMSLVEGTSILLELPDGRQQRFNYVESFVVPAATGRYRLINEGAERVKVVQTFMKAVSSEQ